MIDGYLGLAFVVALIGLITVGQSIHQTIVDYQIGYDRSKEQ